MNADSLRNLVSCPKCKQIPLAKIFSCDRGHLCCHECRFAVFAQNNLNVCQECFNSASSDLRPDICDKCLNLERSEDENPDVDKCLWVGDGDGENESCSRPVFQNAILESMIKLCNLKVSCANKRLGCEKKMPCKAVTEHKKTCKFRRVACPESPECYVPRIGLLRHLEIQHACSVIDGDKETVQLIWHYVEKEFADFKEWETDLFTFGGTLYGIRMCLVNGVVYTWIIADLEAEKSPPSTFVRMVLVHPTVEKNSLTRNGFLEDLETPLATVIENGNALEVSKKYANLFKAEDGQVKMEYYINL